MFTVFVIWAIACVIGLVFAIFGMCQKEKPYKDDRYF